MQLQDRPPKRYRKHPAKLRMWKRKQAKLRRMLFAKPTFNQMVRKQMAKRP